MNMWWNIEKYECPKCWNNMFKDEKIYQWLWVCCNCKYEYDTAKLVYNN